MNVYTVTKKGRNIEFNVTDNVTGAILSYFLDSANFEAIYNKGNIVNFNLYGYISFKTLNISTNAVLLMNATGISGFETLITNQTDFNTYYSFIFS